MDLIKYGEIRGFSKALSTIPFQKYIMYKITFETIKFINNDAAESLMQDYNSKYPNDKYDVFSLIEIHIWQAIITEGFEPFESLDKKVIQSFVTLLNDFFVDYPNVKVWQVESNFNGVYNMEYLFQTDDLLFYLFLWLTD